MKIKDVLQLQLSLLQISGNSTLSEDWRNRLQEVDEEEGMVISNSRYSDICVLHLDIEIFPCKWEILQIHCADGEAPAHDGAA